MVDHTFTIEEINTSVGLMFSQNIQTNPWFQKYKTIFEQPQKIVACAFSRHILYKILLTQATHDTTFTNKDDLE